MKARVAQTLVVIQCAFLVVLLSSCATTRERFNYANVPALELGQLRIEEYPERFGKPTLVGRKTTSEGNFDVVRFREVKGNLAGGASGRELVLEFKEGVLNGFFYVSSFDEDRTNVDLAKTDQIKIETSTR